MSIAKASAVAASTAPTRRAGDVPQAKVPGTALAPLAAPEPAASASLRLNRPDPSFVAHLIAMAEQLPQTRILRRAATADVQAAYRSVANQNEMAGGRTGVRMRRNA
jgi:hypothetical protein